MASYRPYMRPRWAIVLAALICLACCALEPCDGHSCHTPQDRRTP